MFSTCASRRTLSACRALLSQRFVRVAPISGTRIAHRARASSASVPDQGSAATTAEELIKKADYFIHNSGFFGPLTPEALDMIDDDEFVFRGVIVGPLTKKGYTDALGMLRVHSAFPDIKPNPFGFCVDPADPLRVFFFVRQTGTMTEDWDIAGVKYPATGGKMQCGPAAFNFIFTPEGKIKYSGIGYIADRIVSEQVNGSSDVAVLEAFRVAGVPSTKWLFSSGPLQGALRGAVDVATKAAGKPELSPAAVSAEDLPAWFNALPNSKLRYGEGL